MPKDPQARGKTSDETSKGSVATAPSVSTPLAAPGTASSALAVADYDESDLGAGLTELTQDDLQIPFLGILQKGNPQVEEDNPRYIKGAKPGMLFNTVTNETFSGKEGVRVIPVHRTRTFLEWIPRDDGGGLVGVHEPESDAVKAVLAKAGKKFGKLKIGDNNDLVETFNVFALLVNADGAQFDRVVLGFTSSQIGRYKRMMTMANSIQLRTPDNRMVTPPLFAHVFRAKTEFVTKNEYTWYKWVVAFDGADAAACRLGKEDPLYLAAKAFREMVTSGRAKADFAGMQQESTASESTYDM